MLLLPQVQAAMLPLPLHLDHSPGTRNHGGFGSGQSGCDAGAGCGPQIRDDRDVTDGSRCGVIPGFPIVIEFRLNL